MDIGQEVGSTIRPRGIYRNLPHLCDNWNDNDNNDDDKQQQQTTNNNNKQQDDEDRKYRPCGNIMIAALVLGVGSLFWFLSRLNKRLLWNGTTKKFVDVHYRHCRPVLPSHMIGENIAISKIQSAQPQPRIILFQQCRFINTTHNKNKNLNNTKQ